VNYFYRINLAYWSIAVEFQLCTLLIFVAGKLGWKATVVSGLLVESCIRTAEAYELMTTLSVSLTVFLGYLPAAARATASPFLPRQFERLFEDLDFHGFAAEEGFNHYLMTQVDNGDPTSGQRGYSIFITRHGIWLSAIKYFLFHVWTVSRSSIVSFAPYTLDRYSITQRYAPVFVEPKSLLIWGASPSECTIASSQRRHSAFADWPGGPDRRQGYQRLARNCIALVVVGWTCWSCCVRAISAPFSTGSASTRAN
jgi:hypothetical protein